MSHRRQLSAKQSFNKIVRDAIEKAARKVTTVAFEDDTMTVGITTFKKVPNQVQDAVQVRAALYTEGSHIVRRKSMGRGYAWLSEDSRECKAIMITDGIDMTFAKRCAVFAKHNLTRSWEFAEKSAIETGVPVGYSELEARKDAQEFVKRNAKKRVAAAQAANPLLNMTAEEAAAATAEEEAAIWAELNAALEASQDVSGDAEIALAESAAAVMDNDA